MLDHLPRLGDTGGPQQLTELGEVVGVVVRERSDQVRPLAGTALRAPILRR
jgi:hypothetical protein